MWRAKAMKRPTAKAKPAAGARPAPAKSQSTSAKKPNPLKTKAQPSAAASKPATASPKSAQAKPAALSKSALIIKAAETLAPGAMKVSARVRLAVENPTGYVTRHRPELAKRGVTAPTPRLPFFALLDGLDADGRVALVEGNASAKEVLLRVRKLKAPNKLDFRWADSLDFTSLENVTAERFLQAIAARAEPAGVVFLSLDTGTDQHAVVMVDRSRVNITLAAMKAAGYPARIVAVKALVEKAKPAAKRTRGGAPLEEWPECDADPSNTWRYFIDKDGTRSLCLRKWPQAFDLMHESLKSPAPSRSEKKSFATVQQCREAYVAFYAELAKDGWLQFAAPEHAKELKARASSRK